MAPTSETRTHSEKGKLGATCIRNTPDITQGKGKCISIMVHIYLRDIFVGNVFAC